jgi:hypothetical protein
MYLIIKVGNRLCQDKYWRRFANFGTYPECVKEYKSLYHARRAAKRFKGQVAKVPDEMEIDSSGDVMERLPIKPGFERIIRHNLEEFIV